MCRGCHGFFRGNGRGVTNYQTLIDDLIFGAKIDPGFVLGLALPEIEFWHSRAIAYEKRERAHAEQQQQRENLRAGK